MPVTPTYPGVYIEEVPSAVRTITGVSTSVTRFIGRTRRGPADRVTVIHGFGEYERVFGSLGGRSAMGYAVQHYFLNGGATAVIVRVHGGATASAIALGNGVTLAVASPGAWGDRLRARVDQNTIDLAGRGRDWRRSMSRSNESNRSIPRSTPDPRSC